MINKVFAFLAGLFLIAGEISGQDKLSKQEIVQRMKDGRFAEAYNSLELNYKKFPKDPDYIFYLGVCKVQLNYDLQKAINLLNEAVQQGTYKESWFYMAKANMLNYQFSNASEMFARFNEKANREEKERVQLALTQSMCRNAAELCQRAKRLNVIKADTIVENAVHAYLNKQQIGGKLAFSGEGAQLSSRDRNGVVFSTNSLSIQTKYSFGKKHKDIFLSEADDIEINKYKTIGNTVNSTNEEEFVYYDETVPALYFSSQGHNSIGGFDIFRSYYDKASGKWSKPENLGFPINTPGDEIAYVNIPGTKRSLLVSRRSAQPGKLVVYTLENAEDSPEEEIAASQALELSRLRPGKQVAVPVSKSKKPENKTIATSKNEVPIEIREERTYQKLLHEALSLQVRSDSLKRACDDKKELLISAKTENEKTKLWQEIKALDIKAEDVQQKADALYKKARLIEAEKQEMARQNSQELGKKAFSSKNNVASKPTNTADVQKNSLESFHDVQYRIQVGVFSKLQPEANFKGFTNLYKEDLRDGTAFKYYVGLYKKVTDAEKGLVKAKEAGFRDAYIIGFYNGRVVPLSRARELELANDKQKE